MSDKRIMQIGLVLVIALPVAVLVILRYQSTRLEPVTPAASPAAASHVEPHTPEFSPIDEKLEAEAGQAIRERLQDRLNAIADAYNDGNIKAIELALWPNHAVVRPNGEHLDREGVLRNWQGEWEELTNRKLQLALLSFDQQGDLVNASWTVDLTGEIYDEEGERHAFAFHGVQEGHYRLLSNEERLESPITYSTFEQTMDGEPWGGSQ